MRNFLCHLFIPHEANNHRAKLLHLESLTITIALLIFSSFLMFAFSKNHPEVLGISYNITPEELLIATNKIRYEKGLSQLKLDSELSQAAANKAADMFRKNYWAHIAPDGITPWNFIKNSNYEYLYAGENLARGFSNTSEVVSAWMASPTHRDNMLSANYNDVGFAIATGPLTGNDTVLVVEMFGTKYVSKQLAQNTSETVAQTSPIPPGIPQSSTVPISPQPESPQSINPQVASLQQLPLIDKDNFTKNIAIIILICFITVLALDAIIIERKKITRAVSHNLDHILYFIIILSAIIVIGKGLVL